jgi:hypothetical protein
MKSVEGQTSVEAGLNTSAVTLQVVGGDEKGSLRTETVKYGREYQGRKTRKNALARAPSSKRAPHKDTTATVKQ